MKIIDLISLCTDYTNITVWKDGEEIACYDGKDSIQEDLNDKDIISISSGYYKIDIEIK